MKKIYLLLYILIFHIGQDTLGQKLKYKDIFAQIKLKKYDVALPMIDAFLKNSKNASHANAHLQKGLYFESQLDGYHILADSVVLLETCDSAIFYLNKAKGLITEKELKKNSDYYQAFYRRDLRTGDFGIKLSDVQLDIEKKNQSLQKLNKYAKIIHKNLRTADNNYAESFEQYKHLSTLYGNENDFALMANEQEIDAVSGMVSRTDSINTAIDNVRDAVSKLGRKGYSPEINFLPINDFAMDGKTGTDFYLNDIDVWDYETWANALQQKMRSDVNRMRDNLTNTYADLDAKFNMAKSGGSISESDLVRVLDPTLKDQLRNLDEDPLPEKLLNILIDHTLFEFITDKRLNLKLEDETDVNYQLAIADSINILIDDISNQASALVEPYTTTGAKKYSSFIQDNYGGEFGLIKYRKSIVAEFEKQKNKWAELQSYWDGKSKWGVSEDLADSIYLIPRTDSSYVSMELSKFYTLAVMEDDSANIFAMGLEFEGDKDEGYIAKIGNDRVIDWKLNFALDKFVYDDERLRVGGAYVPSSENKIAAYLYSSVEESENNFILFNADLTGEMNWATCVKINNEPVSIKFNDIVKETNVFLMDEEALESYEGDDPIYIVFDRKGNKVR